MRRTSVLLASALLASGCASAPPAGPPTPWHDLEAAEEAARAGDRAGAVRILRALVASHPRRREPRLRLGLLLLEEGSDEAAAVLAPLARPGEREALLALAEASLRRDDREAAARALRLLARSPGPPDPRPYLIRAELDRRAGDPDAAEDSIRQALVADPGNPRALVARARLALGRNDPAAAAEALEALRRANPGHPPIPGVDRPPR